MAKQLEDYRGGNPPTVYPVDQVGMFRELEMQKIALGADEAGQQPDRILIAFESGEPGIELGYVIDNKTQADEFISILIDARNRLWPTP